MQVKKDTVREKYACNPIDSDTFNAIPSQNLAVVDQVSNVSLSALTINYGIHHPTSSLLSMNI